MNTSADAAGAPVLTWQQHALYRLMADISEDCWCAGWMGENEFALWALVSDAAEGRRYGMREVSESDVEKMRDISDHIGGWIYWHDDAFEPGLPYDECGPRFVAMPAWLARVARKP